jgi:hypothetical protein
VINVVFNHEDLFKHFSHAFEQTWRQELAQWSTQHFPFNGMD